MGGHVWEGTHPGHIPDMAAPMDTRVLRPWPIRARGTRLTRRVARYRLRTMSPKGMVPKVVVKVQSDIVASGAELTADSIQSYLAGATQHDRDRLYSSMNTYLTGDDVKLKAFKTTPKGDKPDWLVQFVLDPKLTKYSGKNFTRAEQVYEEADDECWMTADEYAGPRGLNNKQHALLAIKDFESRPHKQSASLAAAGVKQYKIISDSASRKKRKTQGAEVEGVASIDEDAYAEVQKDLAAPSFNAVSKQTKKLSKPQAALTQKDKAHKVMLDRKQKVMKTSKTFVDKCRIEVKDISIIKAKLQGKLGWGVGAADFLQAKCDEQELQVATWANRIYIHIDIQIDLFIRILFIFI